MILWVIVLIVMVFIVLFFEVVYVLDNLWVVVVDFDIYWDVRCGYSVCGMC